MCNGDDICEMGICVSSEPLDCDDGDACTADSCDEISGCVNTPIEFCAAVPATSIWGQVSLVSLLVVAGAILLAQRKRALLAM